jgi:hypothetical protein
MKRVIVRSVNLFQLEQIQCHRRERIGIIPYYISRGEKYYVFGESGDHWLTDFGGKCYKKESLFSCLIRELQEEITSLASRIIYQLSRNRNQNVYVTETFYANGYHTIKALILLRIPKSFIYFPLKSKEKLQFRIIRESKIKKTIKYYFLNQGLRNFLEIQRYGRKYSIT